MPSIMANAKVQGDESERMQSGLMGMCIFFLIFTTIVVSFRLGCQIVAHRRLYWDDIWIVVALILNDILLGVNTLGVRNGTGLHMGDFLAQHPDPLANALVLAKIGLTNATTSQIVLYAAKMSVLHLYRRIFWSARWFRIAWWVNVVYINLWVLASFFTELLQCLPVSFYWNRVYLDLPIKSGFTPRGHCLNPDFINYLSVLNVLSSVGIWAMPMVALFKLQMEWRKKVELGLLLSLGACACSCGLGKAANARKALTTPDQTWYTSIIFIWSVLEENLTILCACIVVTVGCLRSLRRKGPKNGSAGSVLPDRSGGGGSSSGKGYSRISIEMKPIQKDSAGESV